MLLTLVVKALLPHSISAVTVDNDVLEDCFAFVLTREVILLALVDQVVFASVVSALVLLVTTSAWFARKPS